MKRLCLVFTILVALSAHAQHTSNLHDQYQFKSLTIDDGLSNNRVRTMTQDQYGFLWMGTRKGISRYDGHSFKNYTTHFINDTLSENMAELRESVFDQRGNLWFGGFNGVFKYNLNKDRFDRVSLTDDNVVRNCFGLAVDEDSTLWVTLSDRLIHYNPKDNIRKAYVHNKLDSVTSPPSANMERVTLDRKGNVWITSRQGLIQFNKTSKKFKHYKPTGNPNDLAGNYVEKVYEDPDGNIWVSYRDEGFSRYNAGSNTFKTFFPDKTVKQSGRVRGLLVDSKGNFWVGTQNGMYLFDRQSETCIHYASMSHPKSRLTHNSIYFFFLDQHQNLWLGTHAGGVCYTNLNTSGFTKYEYSPISNNYFLNDNSVYALAIDDNNDIWVGTGSGGLNHIERKSGKFKYYVNNVADKTSIPGNDVKAILATGNKVWVGVFGAGLSYLDMNSGRFVSANSFNKDNKLHSLSVTSLLVDPVHNDWIWVGTESGLSLLNLTTKQFTQTTPGSISGFEIPQGLGTQKVAKVVRINNHTVGIAADGIYILDHNTNRITKTMQVNNVDVATSQFGHADDKGVFWVGSTRNHLFRIDHDGNASDVYTTAQGLPDVELYGGLDDGEGNLWISSNKGLYRFKGLINNPDTLITDRFDADDNLQSIEFNVGAYAKGTDNDLFFGGINGFNSFKASRIQDNPYKPFVEITNLAIENKDVAIDEEVNGNVVLSQSILTTEKMEIFHKTKSFTFTFNALHFSAPQSNELAYKLEGYDNHWTYLKGSVGTATYTSIPPGKYVFKVKGANNDGVWNNMGDAIAIVIPTPFYKTIWFYVLVTLTFGAMVYRFIKVREKKLKADKKALQLAIDEKKNEIESVKQEILKNDEANRITNWLNSSLKEFSILSNKSKDDMRTLGKATLSFFKNTINTPTGTILLLNDSDPDNIHLENIMIPLGDANKTAREVNPNEGLAGTCFSQGERMVLTNVPKDYVKIVSGLGEARPKSLLFVPIKIEEQSLGVIELCSFETFPPHYIELVENVMESLASTLLIMRTNQITQTLLSQTQQQREQLLSQEEEMRQSMEELESTTESYKRREQELEQRIKQLSGNMN